MLEHHLDTDQEKLSQYIELGWRVKSCLSSYILRLYNKKAKLKTLSELVRSSHINTHRSTAQQPLTGDASLQMCLWQDMSSRHVPNLPATRFIRFTRALWFSINFGKQITSENVGDSKRNMASDLPWGLHSKTADVHSSIILVPVCSHSFDVLSKSYLYKIMK